ncbi:MAG: histidinol-phosphatase HisJ family protein [Clostridia bacterium]|nr:histidinol-phosphatase HisJ family protein [Clostridia bacterium]
MTLRDYHIHSSFSFDSRAPMEETVKTAIKRGLSEIAFTDHYDPYANAPQAPDFDINEFFAEIGRLRTLYADKITIVAGIEAGQAQLYGEHIARFLPKYPFDFVIGSVHNVTGDIDLAFETYTLANVSSWLERYFLEAQQAAKTGLYDVFGHLNYICRYINKQDIPITIHDYEDLAILVLREVIAHGKGIEINVSTLRDKKPMTLPSIELIKKYRSMGGEILTIGSDAHTSANVGIGIEKGIELAKRAGFKYISTFKNRQPEFCKID